MKMETYGSWYGLKFENLDSWSRLEDKVKQTCDLMVL